MKIALSTLAMSAYNVIARNGGPLAAGKLHTIVTTALEDPGITRDFFAAALVRLESMKYIIIVDQALGLIDVTDPKRSLVRWRDRGGDGWSGWKVEGERGLPQSLSIDLGDAQ